MSIVRFLSLVILAVWVGGLAILGAVTAPTIFSALQAHDPVGGRTLAADVFGAIFQRFQHVSWLLGGLLLALLALRAALGPRPRHTGLRVLMIAVMIAISVGTALLITPRINQLRVEAAGPLASLPDPDPRKIEFNRLH